MFAVAQCYTLTNGAHISSL